MDSDNVGIATKHFLGLPGKFEWWQFLGVAFIVWMLARHWGLFVNDITG